MTKITIDTPPAFDFNATQRSHGWRRLAPFRWNEDAPDELHYTLQLSTGRVAVITMRDGLSVTTDLNLTDAETDDVRAAVRTIFSLDEDLSPFYDLIAQEPRYNWVRRAGAGRMLASPTVWEDAVKTLFTTNVSWSNTVNMTARLTDYGSPATDGSRAFPTPEQVLAQPADDLNAHVRSGYRINSLYRLAETVADNTLNIEAWRDPHRDPATLYKEITAQHGFGAYAAGALMRLLGHHNHLGLDSVCRGMFARRFGGGAPRPDSEIIDFYAPFGRWRGLALWMDVIDPSDE